MKSAHKNSYSLIGLVGLFLMFCLPFVVSYHKPPIGTYYTEVVAFALGALSLFALLRPSKIGLMFPPMVFVPVVLALLLTVQWMLGIGVYWQETTLGVLYLFWAALLMLAVAHLKESYTLETLVTWLAYALVLGGLLNVLVVLMQLIGADQSFLTFGRQGTSYTGNLAQVNLLTDYLSLSMVSLFYLHIKNKIKASTVYSLVFPFLMALTLTGSRMSWLYVVMISLSFFILGRTSQQSTWQAKSKYLLVLPFIFGLVQICLPFIVDNLMGGLIPPAPVDRLVEFSGQQSVRLEYIKEAFSIVSQHPWLGVGWGQLVWYDLIFADTYANHAGFVSHTHNLFVQILVECGIFALLALLIGGVYWCLQLFKQQNTIERWWLVLIGGIIFTHSLLEYPLWYSHFLGVFVVVIALADQGVSCKCIKPIATKIGAGLVVMAVLIVIGITTYQYRQIEYWMQHYTKLNDQQRVMMLNEMSSLYQHTLVAEPLHLILTRAYSILPNNRAPLKAKIAQYEGVLHYVQAKEDVYRYVLLLASDGQTQKASDYLSRAYTRHPGYAEQFGQQLVKLLSKPVNKGNQSLLSLQKQLKQLQSAKQG